MRVRALYTGDNRWTFWKENVLCHEVRMKNNSGRTPAVDHTYEIEYMTERVNGGKIRWVILALRDQRASHLMLGTGGPGKKRQRRRETRA